MVARKSIVFAPLRIRFRGEYDYDGLLDLIRNHFAKHLFGELKEPVFKYKSRPTGAEVEFKMLSNRNVTHYIKVYLTVKGRMWDMLREQKVIDGEKRIRTNGKLELYLIGEWELDYANQFGTAPDDKAIQRLQNAAEKWMQSNLDRPDGGLKYGDNKMTGKKYVENIIKSLHDDIKSFLGMEAML